MADDGKTEIADDIRELSFEAALAELDEAGEAQHAQDLTRTTGPFCCGLH